MSPKHSDRQKWRASRSAVSSTGQRNTRLIGEASLASIGRCCDGPLLGGGQGDDLGDTRTGGDASVHGTIGQRGTDTLVAVAAPFESHRGHFPNGQSGLSSSPPGEWPNRRARAADLGVLGRRPPHALDVRSQ